MSGQFQPILNRIKQDPAISSDMDHFNSINAIEKYATSDADFAYLLGYFFNNNIDIDRLHSGIKTDLLKILRVNQLEIYYYLKSKPKNERFSKINYLFIFLGLLITIAGAFQMIRGNFWLGFGTKYQAPILHEGGYKVILGLVFLISGFIRLRFEMKQQAFFKVFLNSTQRSSSNQTQTEKS